MSSYESSSDFNLRTIVFDLLSGLAKARKFEVKHLDFSVILNHLQEKYPEERINRVWLSTTLFSMLPPDTDVPRTFIRSKWAVLGGKVTAFFSRPIMTLGCSPSAKTNTAASRRPKSSTYCHPDTLELATLDDVDDCWGMINDINDSCHVIDAVASTLVHKNPEFKDLGFVFDGCDPMDCRFMTFKDAKADYPTIKEEPTDDGLGDTDGYSWVAMMNLFEEDTIDYAEDRVYQKFRNDKAFRRDVMDIFCAPNDNRKNIIEITA